MRGTREIGTTGRGIGPAYEDKVARRAVRAQDLFDAARFAERVREALDLHNFVLAALPEVRRPVDCATSHRRDDGAGGPPAADDHRRVVPSERRDGSQAPNCCSKARRAHCSTSTTAPIRT